MAGGPIPDKWIGARVIIELNGGSGSGFEAVLDDESNEHACIVMREVPEEGSPEPVSRLFLYPWASIRSIKLLEGSAERRTHRPIRTVEVVRTVREKDDEAGEGEA